MKTSQTGRLSVSTKRTMQLLADTMLSLLEKESLEKITVMDVCARAQVPRATFYNHFEDKYDLLRYALGLIVSEIKAEIPEEGDEKQKTMKLFEQLLDFAQKNYAVLKKVSSANYNSILFSEVKNLFCRDLTDYLKELEASGQSFRVDPKIVAEFYSNGIVYTAKTWIEEDMKTPKEEILGSAENLILFDRITGR